MSIAGGAGVGLVLVLVLAALLLKPSGGIRSAILLAVVVWLVLAAAIATVVAVIRFRPARRISIAVLTVAGLLVTVGLPLDGWWTFAVDHGPTGESCASCAVIDYFAGGPMGGYTTDELTFDRVLCDSDRDRLRTQAQQIATDIRTSTSGTSWGFASAASTDEHLSTHGHSTTLVGTVQFTYARNDPANGPEFLNDNAGTWTFTLNHNDGWQICRIDTPHLCGTVLTCTHAPAPSPPTPGMEGVTYESSHGDGNLHPSGGLGDVY